MGHCFSMDFRLSLYIQTLAPYHRAPGITIACQLNSNFLFVLISRDVDCFLFSKVFVIHTLADHIGMKMIEVHHETHHVASRHSHRFIFPFRHIFIPIHSGPVGTAADQTLNDNPLINSSNGIQIQNADSLYAFKMEVETMSFNHASTGIQSFFSSFITLSDCVFIFSVEVSDIL